MIYQARNRKQRNATTLVETAIVISVCLLFLFGIVEYGRFLMIQHLINNAAREGARRAVAGTNTATPTTTADIQNTVTTALAGQYLQNVSITVYKADPTTGASQGVWTDTAFGDGIAVKVTGDYQPMLPTLVLQKGLAVFSGFQTQTITVKATALMRSEGN